MAAIDINWKPTPRQLRQFGLAAFVALPLVGWLFSGWPGFATWTEFHTYLVGGLAAGGTLLAVLAFVAPRAVVPVFIGATLIAFPIGLVLSEVIMLLIYGLVFAPVAIIFRLKGRDALDRTLDRQADTYWEPKSQPPQLSSYYRQS